MEGRIASVATSTRQTKPRRPEGSAEPVLCDICGAKMLAAHCKLRCVHCGYTRDCSDP